MSEKRVRQRFGATLRGLRKGCGLTQGMVADEFGLTQATISSWESGRRGPDMHMLIHLAAFFDISVDGLLGRADPCVICQSTDRSRSYPAPESEGGGENILCANCAEAVAS